MVTTAVAPLVLAVVIAGPPVDAVIVHARIWSPDRTGFASFAAVDDGRFVAVGDSDPALIGPTTRVIDAGGRVVIPGIIESHVHMLGGGLGLAELDLRHTADKEDFIRRVRAWATDLPDGAWIRGGRWSTESWDHVEQPTRAWIDEASLGHPLYLPRMDGHSALVNSVALEMAGITAASPPDPLGGVIDRDPVTGVPTGMLRESAMGLVAGFAPSADIDAQVAALRSAMAHANRHGITAVADIPGISDLDAYARLASEGALTVRFFLYPTASDWEDASRRVAGFEGRDGWVRINGLKTYLDGSLGSRTAFMREPFLGNEAHRPHWHGLLREDVEGGRLEANLRAAADAGLQAIAHAIGDEANHLLLDTLEATYEDLPAARCRSEHAQHLLPDDITRFGALGVIASMQPYHKADDGRYAESYLGPDRCRSSYAFRSLLDRGAVVVFGSDWPVVSIDPFLGIEAAVTGRTLDGHAWQTQETITVGEALRCYTDRAAYGVRAERELGRIARGYRADFVVLEHSPFEPDVEWDALAPHAVFVDGERVEIGP